MGEENKATGMVAYIGDKPVGVCEEIPTLTELDPAAGAEAVAGGTVTAEKLVVIVSMALTVAVFLAIFQIKAMAITWYMIAAVLVLGIFVAYAAMFGFDKFREALEQINRYRE